MIRLVRASLALVGLAMVAPSGVFAQDSGYGSSPAPAPAGAPGPDSRSMPVPGASNQPGGPSMGFSTPVAEQPHVHKRRTICAACAAKAKQAQQGMMPPGQIVRCEHSKDGICPACREYLNKPGTWSMKDAPASAPAPASGYVPMSPEAAGRAVATSSAGARGMASRTNPGVSTAFGQDMGDDPAPIGVIQTNYAQSNGPSGMPAQTPNQVQGQGGAMSSMPGHAVASSSAGSTPYAPKNGPFPHPHILGHLFGFSGIGNERRDEKAQKKAAAHASISYDNEGTTVNEIPASMLKKGH